MIFEDFKIKYFGVEIFIFGDGLGFCVELFLFVCSGKKMVICGVFCDFEEGGELKLIFGWCDIVFNWDGLLVLVIEIIDVWIVWFCDMDEDFVLVEGENEDFVGWWCDYQVYFECNGGFELDMKFICECFRFVEDFQCEEL